MLEDEKTDEKSEDEKTDEKSEDEKSEDENENKHYVDEIAKLTEQVETLTKTLQEVNREKAEGNAPEVISGEQILKDIIEGKVK